MSEEPMYEDVLLTIARMEREADERAGFCRICWGALDGCPGHVGWLEMFGPPPSEAELAAHRADWKVRQRGLQRREKALDAAAQKMGYGGIDDLVDKTMR